MSRNSTLTRISNIEHDDDAKVMTILRVEGDVRTNVGDYMLTGGKYWSEVWVWEQGACALDTGLIPEED